MSEELKAAVERAWVATACKATGDKHDVTSTFLRALADEPEVVAHLYNSKARLGWGRADVRDILRALAEIVR
jgi:hypothetical protein